VDQNSDIEIAKMTEDLGPTLKENRKIGRRRTSLDLKSQGWGIVFGGVGVLLLITIFILISGGDDKGSSEDLNLIKAGITQMDKRIQRIDDVEKRASYLEAEVKGLKQSMSKIERTGGSLKKGLDELTQKMDRLQRGTGPPTVKKGTKPTIKKEPISQEKRQYHIVRSGDTLYRIAIKYGISLSELRRINNLTPNQDIYPNQKLLVTP
jgi:LysM repeat protein